MRKGFTLIEMSVVLVIIGLIVGGILAGKSIIRTSQLQTVIKDVANYQGAVSQFKQKYNALPGDIPNATSFWGTGTITNGCNSGTNATCNGNGDGQITLNSSSPYEQFLVWQHLAYGGFITGTYSATTAPPSYYPVYCASQVNCPGGQLNYAQAYFLQYSLAVGSSTLYWQQGPGHYLTVGEMNGTGQYPGGALVSGSEAAALDGKVDDGRPGLGIWKSFAPNCNSAYCPQNIYNCVSTSTTNSAQLATGAIANELTAVYNTSYGSRPVCAFTIFMNF